MSERVFSADEIENDWRRLIDLGPRFPGTPNEDAAREYIISSLRGVADGIQEHEYRYFGWSLIEPPQLRVCRPSSYAMPCEAFIYCSPTPAQGIRGTVEYVGRHWIIGSYQWIKFAVVDSKSEIVAYVSGRQDGPAQPQPLDRASSPKPHFIIGEYELGLLLSWLERGLEVVVEGIIRCKVDPEAGSKNVIASFNPHASARRTCLCAHYDSVYGCPGANDNAGGVAALLAIGRRVAVEDPRPPLDLIFFSGEEWELAGSRAYVADRLAGEAAGDIKMLINLDGISEGHSLEFWVGPEAFEAELKRVVDEFAHPRRVRKTFCFPPPLGSDHIPFYRAGIPVCMISFGDMIKYHLKRDTYCSEGVDNIAYVAELTWHILEAFAGRDDVWPTTHGLLPSNAPGSWL